MRNYKTYWYVQHIKYYSNIRLFISCIINLKYYYLKCNHITISKIHIFISDLPLKSEFNLFFWNIISKTKIHTTSGHVHTFETLHSPYESAPQNNSILLNYTGIICTFSVPSRCESEVACSPSALCRRQQGSAPVPTEQARFLWRVREPRWCSVTLCSDMHGVQEPLCLY